MKPTYEELEQQVLELSVQLANAESKCRELAAENGTVKGQEPKAWYIRLSDEVTTDPSEAGMWRGVPLVLNDVETPATDAYLAEVRASAIPDGYILVPEQMYLDAEDIQAICMQCGDGNKKGYGEFVDGIFWVGELSNDEDVIKYGLNVADANYPGEGSITVFEFDKPSFAAQLRQGAAL